VYSNTICSISRALVRLFIPSLFNYLGPAWSESVHGQKIFTVISAHFTFRFSSRAVVAIAIIIVHCLCLCDRKRALLANFIFFSMPPYAIIACSVVCFIISISRLYTSTDTDTPPPRSSSTHRSS